MAISKFELEELLETLKAIRGRHTELVTVYIPSGANINVIGHQIDSERSTADNIKSKTVRKNVLDALESISRDLKKYKQTMPNGMAFFCGNVSEKEGQQDLKLWVIEPPEPLKVRLYRCDQQFVLDPLEGMMEVTEVYGLVVMDRREATIGLLEGKQIKVIRKLTSGVPGKFRAGGQSSQRLHRVTEGLVVEFFRRISEAMKEAFFDLPKLKGIIIGGPMPTKEEFMKEGQLVTKLKDMVIGLKDLGDTSESGLYEMVELSHDLLAKQEFIYEQKLLTDFFEKLGKGKKVAYKKDDLEKAFQYGAVEKIILSKKLKKEELHYYQDKAKAISATVEIVSDETEEGKQFLNIGGIGAILRFEI